MSHRQLHHQGLSHKYSSHILYLFCARTNCSWQSLQYMLLKKDKLKCLRIHSRIFLMPSVAHVT
jgi:hypothetical protein